MSIAPPTFLGADLGAESVLVLQGGDLADTVVVSQSTDGADLIVQQYELGERLTTTIPKSSVSSIQFYGGDGDDRLTVRTDIAVYAQGGAGADILTGGSGADTLDGGDGVDRLVGGGGADVLLGEDGNDQLDGGSDNDLLYGGPDDDRLVGGAGEDRLEGSTGDDYLHGGADDDQLYGGLGDDFLTGFTGDDRLVGHAGDDVLYGADGTDVLFGDEGNDRLSGGNGDDLLYGGEGDDRLLGDAGVDRLEGAVGNDYLNGGAGNDRLDGGVDDDFLNGSTGDDRLLGRAGDDILLGGDGNDVVFGDAGLDRLDGGRGDDSLYGGDDNDLLYGRVGADRLEGAAGEDHLNGGPDNDLLLGGAGNDYLTGEAGEDRLEGSDGDDTLLGGNGPDALHGDAGSDRLEGGNDNDTIYGAGGEDVAFGGPGDDRLEGGDGNDTLGGGNGIDFLFGGSGNDRLSGGEGNDRLEGQAGDDILSGDGGEDVLQAGDGNDQLDGGAGLDLLYGDLGDDTARGGPGDDRVLGGEGNDRLEGGLGNDDLIGGLGDDTLVGDAGNDRLEGEDGADILLGGDGADSLIGGAGGDLVIGGAAVDSLFGSEEGDILIGASTVYDAEPEFLREALARWNQGDDYDDRLAALTDPEAAVRFVPHHTLLADDASDLLDGGGGQDWFVLSAINGVYNPLGASPHHANPHHHANHHEETILLDAPPTVEGFALIDAIDRLENVDPSEAVHSKLAHHGDSSKRGEHYRLLQLVRYADVTHTASADGDWSDPATWLGGAVPTENARVLIPFGATVTVDERVATDLLTVRVDGRLNFATDVDTELRVDTVVVTGTGTLVMGDADNPVERGVSARLLITDNGPMDRAADPFSLGRGLVTHGKVRMHGAAVTPYAAVDFGLLANTTTIRLRAVPSGWSVGDRISIAGTVAGGAEDEVRVIRAISGGTVTIDPLTYDHAPYEAELDIHVANLTRNVVIESAATENDRRGHVMLMHNRDVEISYTAFNGLGRTDKRRVVTDPQVDGDWNLVGGTDDNPRARYALHFHRNGVRADSPPATVHGSVVDGGPGWGFVNHSSYVDFTDNVAYGVDGAAFVAEAGDEIGKFDNNLAMHTTGTTEDVDARVGQQDFGFNGDGFWLQSPGVSVTNNIAAGSTGSGFIYYSRGLRFGGHTTDFLSENLDDPSIADGRTSLPVIHTPIKRFEGNVGYASDVGLTVRYTLRNAPHEAKSLVSDSLFWNNSTGVHIPYAHNAVLRNLTVLNDRSSSAFNGVDNNSETSDIRFQDLRIEGYQRALIAPLLGSNVVEGGSFISSLTNILISPAAANGTKMLITEDPRFGSFGDLLVKQVTMNFQTDNAARNPNHVLHLLEVTLDYGPYTNQRLYFRNQDPDAVPFPAPLPGLPDNYVGLTQANLWDQFGVAVGGEVAPEDASTSPGVLGLVAPRS